MKRQTSTLLAGCGLWAIAAATPAFAQPAASANPEAAAQQADEAEAAGDEEIVVVARRRAESIQDVPQSIQAVTGETLAKLNLFQFDDISKVVSGVTLSRNANSATMRGVSFNPVAQTTPTVSFYLNESPVQPTFVFQSMFDIGQIEVLRGPQGTLRGQSAPTGAFLISTRRPDLNEWGGYATATLTDDDGRHFEAAVNVPVIPGVLALRLAGQADHTNNGGVRSVNSNAQPSLDTDAIRVSLRFEPTETLSAVLMYQNLRVKTVSLGGTVFGNGAPGGTITNANYALPFVQLPGYNGHPIAIGERSSIQDEADISRTRQEFASALIDYRIAGQKLSYVGGWTHNKLPGSNYSTGDVANMVVGGWIGRVTVSDLKRFTNELRLSSDERLFGFLDYVVGVFHSKETVHNVVHNGLSFQAGAFGSPLGAAVAKAPDLRFSTETQARIDTENKETSFFGNLTAHLFENTELSGGIRFINARKDSLRVNSQTVGLRARPINAGFTAAQCTAGGGTIGATYANVCDFPVPASITGTLPDVWKKTPTVYSATISHHITRDVMAYASYGTSWRPGPTQGALINGRNDPLLNDLSTLEDEASKSIELGLKTNWFDRRLTVNLAYYHQKYDNFVFNILTGIPYLADPNVPGIAPSVVTQFGLNTNINAVVDGIDVDFSARPTDRWNISGGFSWANGRFSNALIPCQDGNFDGTPDTINPTVAAFQAAGVFIAQCVLNGKSAALPKWNANLRSEYTHPITTDIEGFVSGLLTYQPKNPYASTTYTVPSYALINLYLGARDTRARWEVQAFVKNLTNKETVTSKTTVTQVSDTPSVSNLFGQSGYNAISYLAPREFGITFRYSFGSR